MDRDSEQTVEHGLVGTWGTQQLANPGQENSSLDAERKCKLKININFLIYVTKGYDKISDILGWLRQGKNT